MELVKGGKMASSIAMVLLEDWFDVIQVSRLSDAFALFEGALDALVAVKIILKKIIRNFKACYCLEKFT
jgi:hypothetical protein